MATSVFYLNSPSLESATTVFLNAEMTLTAPNGYYQFGGIVRELSGGVLLPPQVCASCAFPCSDYPIDGGGEEGVYKINISVGAGLGAIIVTVNPDAIPSGFIAQYDSAYYNAFSSVTYGYLAATTGATYLGKTADDCGIVAGSPYTLDVYRYNGTDFTLSSNTEVVTAISSQIQTTVDVPSDCIMVIPKINAAPSTLELTIYTTCPYGAFTAEVSCPALLTEFTGTERYASSGGTCDAVQDQTYYVAHVNGAAGTLGLYDWVFTDAYGQNALPDGFYGSTDSLGYIQVENGVIILNSVC